MRNTWQEKLLRSTPYIYDNFIINKVDVQNWRQLSAFGGWDVTSIALYDVTCVDELHICKQQKPYL